DRESARAIRADLPIAVKELAVVQGGHLAERLHGHRLALDGDDAVSGDAGALPGDAVHTAVDDEGIGPYGPGHLILRIVVTGMLPGYPAMRHAVRIQRQDEGMGAAQSRLS